MSARDELVELLEAVMVQTLAVRPLANSPDYYQSQAAELDALADRARALERPALAEVLDGRAADLRQLADEIPAIEAWRLGLADPVDVD